MKNGLKYLLYITILCFILPACKKDKSNDSVISYIRGKIDGVVFECTSNITANTPEPISGPSDPTIRLTGNWQNNSIKLMLISETSSITATSYTFQPDKNRSATLYIGSDAYYAGPSGGPFLPPALRGSGSINIIEVSKNYIRGTFSFASEINTATGFTKNITDGEFHVKRN